MSLVSRTFHGRYVLDKRTSLDISSLVCHVISLWFEKEKKTHEARCRPQTERVLSCDRKWRVLLRTLHAGLDNQSSDDNVWCHSLVLNRSYLNSQHFSWPFLHEGRLKHVSSDLFVLLTIRHKQQPHSSSYACDTIKKCCECELMNPHKISLTDLHHHEDSYSLPFSSSSSSLVGPVVTATTTPSSPQCRCRTRHARGSLTRSPLCQSQRPRRATTDAEGGASLWPSTSLSALRMASAQNMATLSECPSESVCL